MKIILRVYENKEPRQSEFSSVAEAQGIVELMANNYPHLIVEPYIELDDNCVIDISELDKDTFQGCIESSDPAGSVIGLANSGHDESTG